MEIVLGLLLVIFSGLGTGTVAWPVKRIANLHFEHFLFMFMFTGVFLYPWIVTLVTVPDIVEVIKQVGVRPILISNLLSVSWGVANILYMVSVIRIGAALSGAILTALGMSVGIIAPMVLKGSGLFKSSPDIFSTAGIVVLFGLAVVVIGLILIIKAGFGLEKSGTSKGSFMKGLFLVIPAGLLSCGLSLAFVYSQGPVIEAVKLQQVNEIWANFSVWAIGNLGGGIVAFLYPAYIITRKKAWNLLFLRKEEFFFGALAGLQFSISVFLMGRGMILLGVFGASVGFGIQQSMQILGNQLVGFLSGEWKGVYGAPRTTMYMGLIVIIIAVLLFSYSNVLN